MAASVRQRLLNRARERREDIGQEFDPPQLHQ